MIFLLEIKLTIAAKLARASRTAMSGNNSKVPSGENTEVCGAFYPNKLVGYVTLKVFIRIDALHKSNQQKAFSPLLVVHVEENDSLFAHKNLFSFFKWE